MNESDDATRAHKAQLEVVAVRRVTSTEAGPEPRVPRVLLTGFPSFGEHTVNISHEVVREIQLAGISGLDVTTMLLSVDERGSRRVGDLIRGGEVFDAVVHLGLAENRSVISLERYAHNRSEFRIEDNSGRMVSEAVVEGAIERLETTASKHVLDEEFEHENDVVWSESAGAFVCNETIYRTLDAIAAADARAGDGRPVPAIFIHLPADSQIPLARQVEVVSRAALALSSKPRLEVVGALLFDAGGRILACRRPPEDVWGGWWEFPGGKVDFGEEPSDALTREISEELSIEVEVKGVVASLEYEYEDRHVSLEIWNCGVVEPSSITLVEHDEIRWLDRESLESVKWLPADEPLIRKWVESGLPSP